MIPHKSAPSIEAHEPGRVVHVRRERLMSQIDVERKSRIATANVRNGRASGRRPWRAGGHGSAQSRHSSDPSPKSPASEALDRCGHSLRAIGSRESTQQPSRTPFVNVALRKYSTPQVAAPATLNAADIGLVSELLCQYSGWCSPPFNSRQRYHYDGDNEQADHNHPLHRSVMLIWIPTRQELNPVRKNWSN
jgi:hypothetical protein